MAAGSGDADLATAQLYRFIRTRFLKESVARVVPDIRTDRHGWFSHFDEDRSGELSVQEVTRGLIKTYHLAQDVSEGRCGQWWVVAPEPSSPPHRLPASTDCATLLPTSGACTTLTGAARFPGKSSCCRMKGSRTRLLRVSREPESRRGSEGGGAARGGGREGARKP